MLLVVTSFAVVVRAVNLATYQFNGDDPEIHDALGFYLTQNSAPAPERGS